MHTITFSDVLGIDGTTMKSQITLDEMQSVPNGRTVSVSMIKTKKIYIFLTQIWFGECN